MDKFLQYTTLFMVIPLYTAQGWLFESGSTISQGLAAFWLLVEIYYTVRFLNGNKKSSISSPLLLFLTMIAFSWLFSPKEVQAPFLTIPTFGDLKNITIVLLSYYPIRYWLRTGTLNNKSLVIFLLLIVVASVIAFFVLTRKFDMGLYAVTNNTGYYFAMLVPLLGVIINKKLAIPILMVSVYFCVGSAKRGAILCLLSGLILFFYYSTAFASRKKRYQIIIVVIAMLIGVVYFSYEFYMENELLQRRLEKTVAENDTGGRDSIYSALIFYYFGGNLLNMLFGFGFDKTVEAAGNFAHMDWLELLIDNGLLGVILYLNIFIAMFSHYFKNKKYIGKDTTFIFLSMASCWLLKSVFSMGYTHFFSFIFLMEYALFENEVNNYMTKTKIDKIKRL